MGMRKLFEKVFFKLAGFMLLARFQVIHDCTCTGHYGHSTADQQPLFSQLSYLGYTDAAAEMHLMCIEKMTCRCY
jgi:hypothetical protein